MRNRRGYALMLVLGMVALMASTIACLSILTRGRVDDLQLTLDRTTAYYLCETGASTAIMAIRNRQIYRNCPGYNASTKKVTKTFTFRVTNAYSGRYKDYTITYVVSQVSGQWHIEASTDSPYGMGYRYTLIIGGKRAFPFFIKEMGPGLGGM